MNYAQTLVVAALLTACTLSGPLAALAMAPEPAPGRPVLVIGWGAEAAVKRAGGRAVGPVSAPLAVLAQGEGDFIAKLRLGDIWAVRDAGWLAAFCTV